MDPEQIDSLKLLWWLQHGPGSQAPIITEADTPSGEIYDLEALSNSARGMQAGGMSPFAVVDSAARQSLPSNDVTVPQPSPAAVRNERQPGEYYRVKGVQGVPRPPVPVDDSAVMGGAGSMMGYASMQPPVDIDTPSTPTISTNKIQSELGPGGLAAAEQTEDAISRQGVVLEKQRADMLGISEDRQIAFNEANSRLRDWADGKRTQLGQMQKRTQLGQMQKQIDTFKTDVLGEKEKDLFDSQLSLAEKKVDPDHFWSSRSTGQQIAAIISMAMGGFVQGFTGGRVPNVAAQMIDKAISRDIQAQQANIVAGRQSVESKKGVLAYLYGRYGDMQKAKMGAIDLIYRNLNSKLTELDVKKKGIAEFYQSHMLAVELKKKHLGNMMEIGTSKLSTQTTQPGVDVYARYQQDMLSQIRRDAAAAKMAGLPIGETSLRQFQGQLSGLYQIDAAVGMVKSSGYGLISRHIPTTDAKRLLDIYLRPIVVNMRKAMGETGVMTEPDYQRYADTLLGNLNTGGELLKRLAMIKSLYVMNLNSTLDVFKAGRRDTMGLRWLLQNKLSASEWANQGRVNMAELEKYRYRPDASTAKGPLMIGWQQYYPGLADGGAQEEKPLPDPGKL